MVFYLPVQRCYPLGQESGFTQVALLQSHICCWKDVVQRQGQPEKETAKQKILIFGFYLAAFEGVA